jgi:hypothetical protein
VYDPLCFLCQWEGRTGSEIGTGTETGSESESQTLGRSIGGTSAA